MWRLQLLISPLRASIAALYDAIMTAVSSECNPCLRFNEISLIRGFLCRATFFSGLAGLLLAVGVPASAEDGYRLWLRYEPVEASLIEPYRHAATQLVMGQETATLKAARVELLRGLDGLLNAAPREVARPTQDGAIMVGTPRSSAVIAALHLDLRTAGDEGYVIRSVKVDGHSTTVIAGNRDAGVLYGVFHWLRLLQTHQPVDELNVLSTPHLQHRVLDHWDNLDGFVERGYAGASLWDWQKLPDYLDPRYTDYARACASLGINGTVLTNVNASALSLTPEYLRKAAALADVFRPYGLRVYLSARMVACKDGRDLSLHPGFRRLSRQGEFRRTARTPGLRALAR